MFIAYCKIELHMLSVRWSGGPDRTNVGVGTVGAAVCMSISHSRIDYQNLKCCTELTT